jgi:hypothetical protein
LEPANPTLLGSQTELQTGPAKVGRIFDNDPSWHSPATLGGPDDFDWGPENKDVLVPDRQAVALYINTWGQIVLRQCGGYDDDVWILINAHDVPRLIERLKDLSKIVLGTS